MPNIQSAKKRVKVSEKKNLRNRIVKSGMRTSIRKFDAAVAADAKNARSLTPPLPLTRRTPMSSCPRLPQ